MPSSMDAASLVREARAGRFAPAIVDGPMAFDLAVSRNAAQGKAFDRFAATHINQSPKRRGALAVAVYVAS